MLWDIPLGYPAPRGPAVRFRVSYEHRDSLQPQTFSFANLGPKWTFDWLSHVTETPVQCRLYYGSS
jgi:hypothetical protein